MQSNGCWPHRNRVIGTSLRLARARSLLDRSIALRGPSFVALCHLGEDGIRCRRAPSIGSARSRATAEGLGAIWWGGRMEIQTVCRPERGMFFTGGPGFCVHESARRRYYGVDTHARVHCVPWLPEAQFIGARECQN